MAGILEGLKIAILLEDGVNEIEFHYSYYRLIEEGAKVIVVGNQKIDYTGELFEKLNAVITIDQVNFKEFDGVVIPGGLAPEKLRLNPKVLDFVKKIYYNGKVCAAICHGQQVFISAGLLKGRRAVAAWSMVDDLIFSGAIHVHEARAVRDRNIITGRFISDLPRFYNLIFKTFSDIEKRPLPSNFGKRLEGKSFGILVDDASYDMHVFYTQGRIKEESGKVVLIGRKKGNIVHLGNDTWEWGDHGYTVTIERGLKNKGAVDSHDFPYEDELQAIKSSEIDGLIIPGGLATWMVRGHPGLKELLKEIDKSGKIISTIGRGPKVLISAGIIKGRKVTCSPKMRDDITSGEVQYRDDPVVIDNNLLSCKGTEYLPEWGKTFIKMVGK